MDATPELTPIPAPEDESVPAEMLLRVCLLSLCGELFAIDLRNVTEVFEVDSITPVPNMPEVMAGVTNLRGVIIPLMDLRPMLGVSGEQPGPKVAVVIRHQGQQVGILIDQVPEIRTAHMNDLTDAPPGAKGLMPFVTSVLKIENRVSGVVEVPSLLACVDSQ